MDGPRDEHQGGRLHQPPERLGAATLPELRPLVLELKSQLLMHGLHETRTGGVGGYHLANYGAPHAHLARGRRQPPSRRARERSWRLGRGPGRVACGALARPRLRRTTEYKLTLGRPTLRIDGLCIMFFRTLYLPTLPASKQYYRHDSRDRHVARGGGAPGRGTRPDHAPPRLSSYRLPIASASRTGARGGDLVTGGRPSECMTISGVFFTLYILVSMYVHFTAPSHGSARTVEW
jgi:hypothetical protein